MRKFKSLSIIIAITMVMFLLVSCGNKEAAGTDTNTGTADAKVIKMAFNQSENHPQYKAMSEFSDELFEKTNGAYKIEISPNELLGSQKESFESVQNGSIEMALVANTIVENVDQNFTFLSLPYVFDSIDHQKEVFVSDILTDLFNGTEQKGFNVLTAFTAGTRSIYTDKPIEKPEDLKGYKIRVMESPTSIKMLEAMGGVATPMAQGEVYTAIQQNVIEGGENNEITYADLKHYEVSPYYSNTKHLMIPDLVIINSDFFNTMDDETKAIVHELSKKYTEREFELWNEQIEGAKKEAVDAGATFIDVDIKPFQENCKPLIDETISKSEESKAIYEEIRGMAK